MNVVHVKKALQKYASPERAKINAWFFKTGKGQYGEGDEFIGVTVPNVHSVAKQYCMLSFVDIETLLLSKKHEHRLCALLILVQRYKKGIEAERKEIVSFYLAHIDRVNNWDLVDLSCHQIVGSYMVNKRSYTPLKALAKKTSLWERRIAIVSTYAFIREGVFEPTLDIAKMLLTDREDLIHKAVGWMLREVGKKDGAVLRAFLAEHYASMPRTMLRYSIERFPEAERRSWLTRDVLKQ